MIKQDGQQGVGHVKSDGMANTGTERLHGRVAIVTGAGRGIGEAITAEFARQGCHVVGVSRTSTELKSVASRAGQAGGDVRVQSGDVSEPGFAERVAQHAIEQFGHVDILVNAAGIYGPIGRLFEINPDDWMRAMDVNLYGTFSFSKAILPGLLERGGGKIINFSGGGATSPMAGFSAYGTSKAAVVRFTETLAEECRGSGVDINAIAPGAVDTRIQDEVLAAGSRAGELLQRVTRMRETGEGWVPLHVPVSLAVFLASTSSDGLTGKLIAAPHDGWQSWTPQRVAEIANASWFTLRRLDPFTVSALVQP